MNAPERVRATFAIEYFAVPGESPQIGPAEIE